MPAHTDPQLAGCDHVVVVQLQRQHRGPATRRQPDDLRAVPDQAKAAPNARPADADETPGPARRYPDRCRQFGCPCVRCIGGRTTTSCPRARSLRARGGMDMFNGQGLTGNQDGRSTIATAVAHLQLKSDEQLRGQVSHQGWASNSANVGIRSPRHLSSTAAYALRNIRRSASKRRLSHCCCSASVNPRSARMACKVSEHVKFSGPRQPASVRGAPHSARFPDVPSQPEMQLGHL